MERDPYSLLGQYVLIGITRISADGDLLEEGECHGRIALVDPDLGIRVLLSDGEVLTLPPDPDSFRDAKPGRLPASLDRRAGRGPRPDDGLDDPRAAAP